jgi:hypothetical protein
VSWAPNSDCSWDEGYMREAVNPRRRIYFVTGFRITPNVGGIGGHVGTDRGCVTRTLRLSRRWRLHMGKAVDLYRVDFVEPPRAIRLTLGANRAGIEWDQFPVSSQPAKHPLVWRAAGTRGLRCRALRHGGSHFPGRRSSSEAAEHQSISRRAICAVWFRGSENYCIRPDRAGHSLNLLVSAGLEV